MNIHIIPIAATVELATDVSGVVIGVYLRADGSPQYRVRWWHEGQVHEDTFEHFEVVHGGECWELETA